MCGAGTEAVFTALRFSCSEFLLNSLPIPKHLCPVLHTARVGEPQRDAEACGAPPDSVEANGKLFLSFKYIASCKQVLVFMHQWNFTGNDALQAKNAGEKFIR